MSIFFAESLALLQLAGPGEDEICDSQSGLLASVLCKIPAGNSILNHRSFNRKRKVTIYALLYRRTILVVAWELEQLWLVFILKVKNEI